jgi:hypothetical protein
LKAAEGGGVPEGVKAEEGERAPVGRKGTDAKRGLASKAPEPPQLRVGGGRGEAAAPPVTAGATESPRGGNVRPRRALESPERESPAALDRERREDGPCRGECERTALKPNGRDPDRLLVAVLAGDCDLTGV